MKRWLIGLMFVGAVGGAAWMFRAYMAGGERAAAYTAAPACPEDKPASNCRAKVTAEIVSRHATRSGRVTIHSAILRLADGASDTMVVSQAQYDAIAEGQKVEIERWDGTVTRLYRDGEAQALPQTPQALGSLRLMGIAFSVAAIGLLWVLIALRRK